MTKQRDLYQVLGVPRGADSEEIRRAHRRLVRVLHPDRHAQATDAEKRLAERRMREINEAWHTLRDPARRSSYDLTLRNGSTTRSSAARAGGSASQRPRSGSSARSNGASSGSAKRPGGSAPGRGAYWSTSASGHRSTGTRPGAGSRQATGDSQEVGAGTYFLLRRGPLVAIIAAVLGLFVATALISGRDSGETTAVIPEPLGACVLLGEGSEGYLVDCSLANDGEVVAQVEQPLDCPAETRYVQVGTDFFCIPVPLGG